MSSVDSAKAQETDAYLRELTWILEQIAGSVASYPSGLLGWRPGTGMANSASAIANHVSKSTRVYALGFGCGQQVERDREAEFGAAEVDAGTLTAEIRSLVTDLERGLVPLTRERLDRRLLPPQRLWGTGEPREISAREAIKDGRLPPALAGQFQRLELTH